jgi:hypothetical protein
MIQEEQVSSNLSVEAWCEALDVSPSGYYAWRERDSSPREEADARLGDEIERVFTKSRHTYGSHRVWLGLRERGIRTSRKRVERVMRQRGLRSIRARKRRIGRSRHKYAKRRHDYLLKKLIFLSASPLDPTQPGDKLYRLTGSTSNPGRSGGGTAHYRLDHHPIHFLCSEVESQLSFHLQQVQVDDALMPLIRDYYIKEVADKLGRLRPDERIEIERALKQIDEEEARVLRLYAATMVTEENWRNLWAEWQDKRHKLRASLDLLDQKCESYIDDLDEALTIIAKLGILYETLSGGDQKELLRNVVERVVVNTEGEIERVDLLPPFAYLREVCQRVSGGEETSENLARIETGDVAATCSSKVLECDPGRTRTFNRLLKRQLLCH